MARMIQLRHVPDALHLQLKARAALADLPLSDYLIRELHNIVQYPSSEEMRERLMHREAYAGRISPTQVIREERDRR